MEAVLLLLAVAPPLLILRYFQASDRYPEPPRVIWTSFVLGMLSCAPVSMVGALLRPLAGAIPEIWAKGSFDAFFAAALPEEFAKFLILVLYCGRRSEFDEPMDGLVYGSAVSLGFACLENVRYVLGAEGGVGMAVVRAVSAVPSHGADGAIMGYFFSLSRQQPRQRNEFLLLSFAVPAVFHGVYDMMVLVADALPKGDPTVAPLWIAWLCLLAMQFVLAKVLLNAHVRRQEAGIREDDILSYVRLRKRNRLQAGWLILGCGGGLIGLATFGPWFAGPLRSLRLSTLALAAFALRAGWQRLRD